MRIDERIVHHQDALSPQERKAAATLLDHLDDLATYRAAELAVLAGVSKATMSRLFRSLGYADFDEVREHLRALRTAGEPRSADGRADLAAHVVHERDAIARTVENPRVADAVSLLVDARRITVVGWRSGYPVALHLRQQLAHARADVRIAPQPGQVLGEELADLGAGDVLVVMGFRRRPSGFGAFVTEAVATGASLVLIADPTGVHHAARASVWLECPVHGGLAYDSYAAAMSLVSVLADGVLFEVGRAGSDRISAISATYSRLAEVE